MKTTTQTDGPVTLRSAGNPAPPPPPVRHAWATYEVLRWGLACVEITYLGNDNLWSGLRVEIANPKVDVNGVDPLYEAAYKAACVAVQPHGYTLARFARV